MSKRFRIRMPALLLLAGHCIGLAQATETVESAGPFDIVTTRQTRHVQWFNPNGPMVKRRSTHHDRFRLRHRGKDLTIADPDPRSGVPTRYREVQRAWILPSPEPALLVLVGNDWHSSWTLVRERNGQAQVERIATDAPLTPTGIWVDVPQPGRDSRPHARPLLPQRAGRIEGGRWLLLGSAVVFDVEALQAYQLRPHAELDFQRQAVLGLSPAARAIARHAQRRDGGASVIVVDRLDGRPGDVLDIDRSRMRFDEPETLEADWLAHHFEWQGDRLVELPDFVPLPHRGRRLHADRDNGEAAEYRLDAVAIEMGDVVAEILRTRFGGRFEAAPRPYMQGYAQAEPYGNWHVDGHVLVLEYGQWDDHQPSQLGLWPDACCRAGIAALLQRVADALDARLASGRHDGLFEIHDHRP